MIRRLFDNFLEGKLRNQWLETKPIRVYVRKSHRIYEERNLIDTPLPYDDGGIIPFRGPNCLDIANVEVHPDFQKKGVWCNFIQYAEQKCPFPFIMVESVGNPDLREMLTKNGYMIDRESCGLNFYKKIASNT